MALSGDSSIESLTKFVVNTILEKATSKGNIFQADVGEFELEIINTRSGTVLQPYSKEKDYWN
jgi:hypothetical protein